MSRKLPVARAVGPMQLCRYLMSASRGCLGCRLPCCCRAGVHEVDAYPMVLMAPEIPWHPDVGPGRVLHRDHETHLLEREWEWGRGREGRSQVTGGA